MAGVSTLNLSQNTFTERTLDILYEHLKDCGKVELKSIILSQNKIIERKHKAKIEKLRGLGFTVSVWSGKYYLLITLWVYLQKLQY